jgi:hypothetical protein
MARLCSSDWLIKFVWTVQTQPWTGTVVVLDGPPDHVIDFDDDLTYAALQELPGQIRGFRLADRPDDDTIAFQAMLANLPHQQET